ncbi:MAG TPA: macro domain-containing protein [Candidatus Eisenbacteria bacterium]|jgi:O-acetyl-ADP-ribose deacetylase (regulator of RNase III)
MKIEAQIVDITTLAVDAIVNAGNPELTVGGGVCGAIHRKAGPRLAHACTLVAPCPTGQARLTPGFDLPARFVIHAVGPVWRGGYAGEADLLAGAYRSALDLARSEGLKSIAFPAISTGIFGYPVKAATSIAVAAVRGAAAHPWSLERVLFACFDAAVLEAYAEEGIPNSLG